jgi:hypothetical protein
MKMIQMLGASGIIILMVAAVGTHLKIKNPSNIGMRSQITLINFANILL